MDPNKKMVLFVLLSSNVVLIPTERHTRWAHPIVEDAFWTRVMNDTVEARLPFESVDSEYAKSGTPLSHHFHKTLLRDIDDGEGSE